MIEFFVPGDPQVEPTWKQRRGQKHRYPDDPTGELMGWKTTVRLRANQEVNAIIPARRPVKTTYHFWRVRPKGNKTEYPVQRPDFDNYAYSITNVLTGVCYTDDCQIVRHGEEALDWADNDFPAGVLIRVEEI